MCVCSVVFDSFQLQAPLSMEFSRQEDEWVAISSPRGSSQPRDLTHVSCVPALAGEFFTTSATSLQSNYKEIQLVHPKGNQS